jgi:hypothetical protein
MQMWLDFRIFPCDNSLVKVIEKAVTYIMFESEAEFIGEKRLPLAV